MDLVSSRPFGRVVADIAVPALRLRPALELAEFVELRVGGEDVVGLVEGLHRDFPVAVEVQPFAPLVAHVPQPERVEDLRGGKQVVGQRLAVGVHVDEQPAAPGVHLNRCEVSVLRGQRALPVILLADVGARTVQAVGPAVESADKRLSCSAASGLGALRCVDQPAAAVHAHVVVRSELVWPGAHDDDRVVEDVVREVATHLGYLLDTTDLLPNLAPQLVSLGAGIVLRDVGVDADRHGFRKLFCRLKFRSTFGIGHHCLLTAD